MYRYSMKVSLLYNESVVRLRRIIANAKKKTRSTGKMSYSMSPDNHNHGSNVPEGRRARERESRERPSPSPSPSSSRDLSLPSATLFKIKIII
jgi:hypothetical protein